MERIRKILIICLLPILVLAGCAQSNIVEKDSENELSIYELDNYEKDFLNLSTKVKKNTGDKVIIGLSLDSLKEPIWKINKKEFIKRLNTKNCA